MAIWIPAETVGRDGALAHVLYERNEFRRGHLSEREAGFVATERRVIERDGMFIPFPQRRAVRKAFNVLRERTPEDYIRQARARLRAGFIARYWAARRG